MKGGSVIAVCILLTSILFFSSSIHGREFVEKTPQKLVVVIGAPTVSPRHPLPYTCGRLNQPPCIGRPPKKKCSVYIRNCPPGN